MGIPFEPTIALLQTHSSTFVQSGVWTGLFTVALLIVAKYLKQLKGSSRENRGKLYYLYIVEFYMAMEKGLRNSCMNGNNPPGHIVKCRKNVEWNLYCVSWQNTFRGNVLMSVCVCVCVCVCTRTFVCM